MLLNFFLKKKTNSNMFIKEQKERETYTTVSKTKGFL